MAFIDVLINETTEKFNLGGKGLAVISALVSIMNNQTSDGIEGFLDHFHRADLTAHVNAWLQNKSHPQLLPAHLESAIEPDTLQQLACKAGLPIEQTTEVVAFLIPLLVGHLAARKTLFSSQTDEIRKALWSNQIIPPSVAVSAEPQPRPLQQRAASTESRGMKLIRSLPFF